MPGDSCERQQLLTAVSDSSPLILYARIGRLELLKALFDEILIPPAVWHEVVTGATGRIGEREVRQSEWIRQRPLPTGTISTRFANLDLGEAEALALASSLDVDAPILLDDERARRFARDAGLFVIGSAAFLRGPKRWASSLQFDFLLRIYKPQVSTLASVRCRDFCKLPMSSDQIVLLHDKFLNIGCLVDRVKMHESNCVKAYPQSMTIQV